MRSFIHIDARSTAEALSLIEEYSKERRIALLLAGGTDLLALLKHEVLPFWPEALINIKNVPDLTGIAEGDGGIEIGALTKLAQVGESLVVRRKYVILSQAAESVGTPQIRNMGTIGGNLRQHPRCWYYRYPNQVGGKFLCKRKGGTTCYAITGENQYHSIFGSDKGCVAVNPSDIATALVALDARIRIANSQGLRELQMDQFFGNVRPQEIITHIWIPEPKYYSKQVFIKFRFRHSIDFAVASIAVLLSFQDGICTDARIVLGGVAPNPVRALSAEEEIKGKRITEEVVRIAQGAALSDAKPLKKNAYKCEVVRGLIKKAMLG